jgi:hypothetical protein
MNQNHADSLESAITVYGFVTEPLIVSSRAQCPAGHFRVVVPQLAPGNGGNLETNPDQDSETESASFKFVPAAARPRPDESEVPCSGARLRDSELRTVTWLTIMMMAPTT